VAVTLSTACTIPDSACSPKKVTSMNAPFSNLLSRVSPNAHPRAIVETEICRMSENRTVQFWTLGFSPPRRVDENFPRNANGEGASTRLPRRQQGGSAKLDARCRAAWGWPISHSTGLLLTGLGRGGRRFKSCHSDPINRIIRTSTGFSGRTAGAIVRAAGIRAVGGNCNDQSSVARGPSTRRTSSNSA
jgi:hypothetical protein